MSNKSGNATGNSTVMLKIASFIVDKRMLFFLIYACLVIFSFFSSNWTSVESDLKEYLEEDTETKQGIDLMKKQFFTFGSAKVMVANITYQDAQDLKKKMEGLSYVQSVTFCDDDADDADDPEFDSYDDLKKHYNNNSALYTVNFIYDENDDRALTALSELETEIADYKPYVTTDMGNQKMDVINQETATALIMVAFVVVGVLLLTCKSYGEIPILLITFGTAMLINNGTNFLFGKISFIANSVSSILQLALSVDYAIMYINRFKEERANGLSVRDADCVSLSKAVPEIASSSLTTISGLFAMIFMSFRIGEDMGIVLIKAIFISLGTVFTLMPGLIIAFAGLMEKTQHKDRIPRIDFIGRFDYATRHVVPFIFIGVGVLAVYLSMKCPYVYGYSTLHAARTNWVTDAENLIKDNFEDENYVAMVVPNGDYEKEASLIRELEGREEVDHVVGLANTEAKNGYDLTDKLSPREFSEMMDLDYEVAKVLYMSYADDNDEDGRIIGGISSYRVMAMDMIQYLYKKVDEGYVNLNDDDLKELTDANQDIADGRKQLEGKNYDRILVYLNLPEEGTKTFNFLDEMHTIAGHYYGSGKMSDGVYVIGDSTSERDLKNAFAVDNITISVVSAVFVLIILLFTFKSAALPVLLVAVIEGSIFINFSFPTIMHKNMFFLAYLCIDAIQMGANIDYAIVISSRYLELRQSKRRRDTIVECLNFAFPTVITSGTMMVMAGVLLSMITSDCCVYAIGLTLARGTAISIFLVMFVLPQILLLCDKLIMATKFDVSRPVRNTQASGAMRVRGMVKGSLSGTINGRIDAVVNGDVNLNVISGSVVGEEKKLPEKDSAAADGTEERKEPDADAQENVHPEEEHTAKAEGVDGVEFIDLGSDDGKEDK